MPAAPVWDECLPVVVAQMGGLGKLQLLRWFFFYHEGMMEMVVSDWADNAA
jgi:hypothetical protein